MRGAGGREGGREGGSDREEGGSRLVADDGVDDGAQHQYRPAHTQRGLLWALFDGRLELVREGGGGSGWRDLRLQHTIPRAIIPRASGATRVR